MTEIIIRDAAPPMDEEIAFALLDDLRLANENFLRQALPNFPCKVTLERSPRPRLVLEYIGDETGRHGYPAFVKLSGLLRPTAEMRRRLGLAPLGEEQGA